MEIDSNTITLAKENKLTEAEKAELQQQLKKAYYEGSAIISDEEYDNIFDTNTEDIGYKLDDSHFQIFKHTYGMGSLNKAKSFLEGMNWIERLGKPYVIQPKLDGLSMGLYYNQGKLTHALLRGSGVQGENIIENAIKFEGVLPEIEDKEITFVKGEIVISKSKFESITEDAYSNRRNAVSGISRRHDGKYSELLSFYTYGIETINPIPTQNARMMRLHNAGFKVPFTLSELNEHIYTKYGDIRTTAEEFQMDGLVIKQNEIDLSDDYAGRPNTQIALKFPPQGTETIVTGYEWNVGSTGAVVPKILFETVNVQGANFSKAAMGSTQAVIDMGAGIGSKVLVQRMGDVIPKVTKVLEAVNKPEIPTVCPDCGSELTREGANLFCKNPNCIQKLYAASCKVFCSAGIKGVSAQFIHDMIDNRSILRFSQVVTMTPELITSSSKITAGRAQKIVEQYRQYIKNSGTKEFYNMLNINGVSGKAVDKLTEKFAIIEFLQASKEQLTAVLGNSKGTSAYNYKEENMQVIQELINCIEYIKSLN